VKVLDQPFYAEGNIATAGGCLASQYLATWILLRKLLQAAQQEIYEKTRADMSSKADESSDIHIFRALDLMGKASIDSPLSTLFSTRTRG
jgi:hypothetical protein